MKHDLVVFAVGAIFGAVAAYFWGSIRGVISGCFGRAKPKDVPAEKPGTPPPAA